MAEDLHKGFEEPLPHLRIDDFLGKTLVDRLLAHAESHREAFVPTLIGKGELKLATRSSRMLRDFGDLRGELETHFTAVLDKAIQELRLSPINLATLELEMVAHGDGDFYREHIDTATDRPNKTSQRALSGVYYFHRHPKGFSGGALRLLAIARAASAERHYIDIPPGPDTLVLFPAWAPHEVRPIACPTGDFLDSRFAINCWYRHRPGP